MAENTSNPTFTGLANDQPAETGGISNQMIAALYGIGQGLTASSGPSPYPHTTQMGLSAALQGAAGGMGQYAQAMQAQQKYQNDLLAQKIDLYQKVDNFNASRDLGMPQVPYSAFNLRPLPGDTGTQGAAAGSGLLTGGGGGGGGGLLAGGGGSIAAPPGQGATPPNWSNAPDTPAGAGGATTTDPDIASGKAAVIAAAADKGADLQKAIQMAKGTLPADDPAWRDRATHIAAIAAIHGNPRYAESAKAISSSLSGLIAHDNANEVYDAKAKEWRKTPGSVQDTKLNATATAGGTALGGALRDANGNPLTVGGSSAGSTSTAPATGTSDSYRTTVGGMESSNSATSDNPYGIRTTTRDDLNARHPELVGVPNSDQRVIDTLTNDNRSVMRGALGHEPTEDELYYGHFLGATGGSRFLKADPSTPITNVVSPEAIASNPGIFKPGMTVGDVKGVIGNRMSAFSGSQSSSGQPVADAITSQKIKDTTALNKVAKAEVITLYDPNDPTATPHSFNANTQQPMIDAAARNGWSTQMTQTQTATGEGQKTKAVADNSKAEIVTLFDKDGVAHPFNANTDQALIKHLSNNGWTSQQTGDQLASAAGKLTSAQETAKRDAAPPTSTPYFDPNNALTRPVMVDTVHPHSVDGGKTVGYQDIPGNLVPASGLTTGQVSQQAGVGKAVTDVAQQQSDLTKHSRYIDQMQRVLANADPSYIRNHFQEIKEAALGLGMLTPEEANKTNASTVMGSLHVQGVFDQKNVEAISRLTNLDVTQFGKQVAGPGASKEANMSMLALDRHTTDYRQKELSYINDNIATSGKSYSQLEKEYEAKNPFMSKQDETGYNNMLNISTPGKVVAPSGFAHSNDISSWIDKYGWTLNGNKDAVATLRAEAAKLKQAEFNRGAGGK